MENTRNEVIYFLSLPFLRIGGNTKYNILKKIIDFKNKIENTNIGYKNKDVERFIKSMISLNILEYYGLKDKFKIYIFNYDNYIDYFKNDNLNKLYMETLKHILKKLSWFRGNVEIEPNIFKKSDFGRIQEAIETFKKMENKNK